MMLCLCTQMPYGMTPRMIAPAVSFVAQWELRFFHTSVRPDGTV